MKNKFGIEPYCHKIDQEKRQDEKWKERKEVQMKKIKLTIVAIRETDNDFWGGQMRKQTDRQTDRGVE